MSDAQATMELVQGYLQGDGNKRELPDGSVVVEMAHRGRHGRYEVHLAAREDPLAVFCIVHHPIMVPDNKRVPMAEAVTRANFGLPVGRFDLNMSAGDLYFHAAIPLADATLTVDQLVTTLISCLATCDRYQRAFARLVYGDDLSAAEVIAEVEMAMADRD